MKSSNVRDVHIYSEPRTLIIALLASTLILLVLVLLGVVVIWMEQREQAGTIEEHTYRWQTQEQVDRAQDRAIADKKDRD